MNNKASNILACLTSLCVSQSLVAQDVCVTNSAAIPDNSSVGISIPIEVNAPGQLIESLSLDLELSHQWVGDLVVTLQSPSGTIVTLLDRPGIPSTGFPGPFGCGGKDISATFSDDASMLAESMCSTTSVPVITGDVVPSSPMNLMENEPANGQWLLNISDESSYDTGSFIEACLSMTTTMQCSPDMNQDGQLNFFDVSAFLSAFSMQDPAADFTNDNEWNFFDVSAFLNAFSAGCP
ncbi:MAG: GC-type dockerin domain-anchored protein [Phycisphaerales bacterium]|nr:GC-type dockerin domain-anchored protein [Phycisphaerales bacterium]